MCGAAIYLLFGHKNTDLGNFLLTLDLPVGLLRQKGNIPDFLIFQLPDALWAYAFCASLLLIWQKANAAFVCFTAFLLCAFYEGLQYSNVTSGTFDFLDVLWMAAACGAAFFLNKFLIKSKTI